MTLSDNETAIVACDTTRSQRLKKEIPPPDLTTIKDFLRFHIVINRKKIDNERITVDSVNTFAE